MKSVLFAAMLTACYQATTNTADNCRLSCLDDVCPGGLLCNDQKQCSIDGLACSIGPGVDGSTRVCAGSTGGLLGMVCFDPLPPASPVTPFINTDSDLLCQQPQSDEVNACVVIVSDEISITVRAEGMRPLVLWSADTLVLKGTAAIDVSSRNDIDTVGAGANGICVAGHDGKVSGNDGSGGGGGSFGSSGGQGGNATAGTGGGPQSLTQLASLRGGCRGGHGGGAGTNGGASGGAVYLMATNRIEVEGALINASGAGGSPPPQQRGGGGGGSGGTIGFDAPTVMLQTTAIVLALGGGGSSGGSGTLPGFEGDDPGQNGLRADGTLNRCGSGSANRGGAGANGLSLTLRMEAEPGGSANVVGCGGGGGGGGDGIIRVFADDFVEAGAIVRPAVQ